MNVGSQKCKFIIAPLLTKIKFCTRRRNATHMYLMLPVYIRGVSIKHYLSGRQSQKEIVRVVRDYRPERQYLMNIPRIYVCVLI